MKLHKAGNFHYSNLNDKEHAFKHFIKRRAKTKEFQEILEHYLNDQNEDIEEYQILLPKHGRFWDNGHEDIE